MLPVTPPPPPLFPTPPTPPSTHRRGAPSIHRPYPRAAQQPRDDKNNDRDVNVGPISHAAAAAGSWSAHKLRAAGRRPTTE